MMIVCEPGGGSNPARLSSFSATPDPLRGTACIGSIPFRVPAPEHSLHDVHIIFAAARRARRALLVAVNLFRRPASWYRQGAELLPPLWLLAAQSVLCRRIAPNSAIRHDPTRSWRQNLPRALDFWPRPRHWTQVARVQLPNRFGFEGWIAAVMNVVVRSADMA
jgi:hypothetical protein